MNSPIEQLTHEEINNQTHDFPLVVVVENLLSPENVGMTFRVCEAMGVQRLLLTGLTPAPPHRKIAKAARATQKRLPFQHSLDTAKTLEELKADGYTLIGLEITNQSQDLRRFDCTNFEKIVLVVGAEREGISAATLNTLDVTVHIPMFGTGSSMNVVTALSVGLYEIIRQTIRP
ncbi:MAG: TrmH family RNA methyltransferase [Bacteroidota bacterium]